MNIIEGDKVQLIFDPVKSPYMLTAIDVQDEAKKKGISSDDYIALSIITAFMVELWNFYGEEDNEGITRTKWGLAALTTRLTDKYSELRDEISKNLRDPDAIPVLYLMAEEVKALADAEKDAIYAA